MDFVDKEIKKRIEKTINRVVFRQNRVVFCRFMTKIYRFSPFLLRYQIEDRFKDQLSVGIA